MTTTEHYPVPRDVLVMDTADDMTVLPGTMRVEAQERCGCEYSLTHRYGTDGHR